VGQCLAWDVNGAVVQRHYPAFIGWQAKTGVDGAKQQADK
jgi:hypothetical protein